MNSGELTGLLVMVRWCVPVLVLVMVVGVEVGLWAMVRLEGCGIRRLLLAMVGVVGIVEVSVVMLGWIMCWLRWVVVMIFWSGSWCIPGYWL